MHILVPQISIFLSGRHSVSNIQAWMTKPTTRKRCYITKTLVPIPVLAHPKTQQLSNLRVLSRVYPQVYLLPPAEPWAETWRCSRVFPPVLLRAKEAKVDE